jgi:NADPH:quinone reductase-like Zn-dependent oxidoreductase
VKAARLVAFGEVPSFEMQEIADPEPGAGQVVVDLYAAALNHRDIWVYKKPGYCPLPVTLGSDGAGVVAAVGACVRDISVGDEKLERAQVLGAKGGFLYQDPEWPQQARSATGGGLDAAIDSFGGPAWDQCLKALRDGGVLVSFGDTGAPRAAVEGMDIFWGRRSIVGTTMGSPEEYEAMVEHVRAGSWRPVIDSAPATVTSAPAKTCWWWARTQGEWAGTSGAAIQVSTLRCSTTSVPWHYPMPIRCKVPAARSSGCGAAQAATSSWHRQQGD